MTNKALKTTNTSEDGAKIATILNILLMFNYLKIVAKKIT
jgi:hypothetical protein